MTINEEDYVDFKQKFKVIRIVGKHVLIEQKTWNDDSLVFLVPVRFLEASNGAWGNH